jgi:hypothetical protein
MTLQLQTDKNPFQFHIIFLGMNRRIADYRAQDQADPQYSGSDRGRNH